MSRLPAVVIGREEDPRVPKNPKRAADADHKVARIVWYGMRQISGTRDPKGKRKPMEFLASPLASRSASGNTFADGALIFLAPLEVQP